MELKFATLADLNLSRCTIGLSEDGSKSRDRFRSVASALLWTLRDDLFLVNFFLS